METFEPGEKEEDKVMMLPKDHPVYANLNTTFTGFDGLIEDLRSRALNGYVLVSFRGYDGVLFLEDGDVVMGVEQEGSARRTGAPAIEGVRARAAEKNGCINVYGVTPEMAKLLAGCIDAEPVFRDLTAAFTSFERLVEKLGDDGHTGYLEVLAPGQSGAIVFFAGGKVTETVLPAEGQGVPAIQAVFELAANPGAVFNVYRLRSVEREASTSAPAAAAPRLSDPAPVLAFWSDVIGSVEAVVDGLSKPGRFVLSFKETLVNRAVTYPYLDPFAAEFDYRDGKVQFEGGLPEDFSKGLSDCLSDTIARLAFQLKRADLETRIREALRDFSEKHAEVIARFGLEPDIEEFVA